MPSMSVMQNGKQCPVKTISGAWNEFCPLTFVRKSRHIVTS